MQKKLKLYYLEELQSRVTDIILVTSDNIMNTNHQTVIHNIHSNKELIDITL